jgi:anaerobic dimethyl sulfoxide reductase subunit B
MTQYGFFFDQSRCTGCHTCTVACKSYHQLSSGPIKYLRVYQYEKGSFPNVGIHVQWIPCYHCDVPECVEICPTGAMRKEQKYGAVVVDHDQCDGCRLCYEACPYGAPVFGNDETGEEAQKCDMCIDRLERKEMPVCVLACPLRALDFGPMDQLMEIHGDTRDLEDLPGSEITGPSVLFKPRKEKRNLVPYDSDKALELLMRRDPLPPVFTSPSDVIQVDENMVGRNRLVIKHDSVEDLMACTRNDEG